MNKATSALAISFDFEGQRITVAQYLQKLLLRLWDEGEGFSGKRPFGNSGWEYDLYIPLIKARVIPGKLDSDGYVDTMDEKAAHRFVRQLITAAFREIAPQDNDAAQREREIAEALEDLKTLCEFAYQQGFHELGYDPVKIVAARLRDGN